MTLPGFTRREALFLLVGLLCVALALVLGEANLSPNEPEGQAASAMHVPSVHSSGPNGARALGLWLAAVGFDARSIELRPFAVDPDARALFLLEPSEDLTDADAARVASWVEAGGRLVVAAENAPHLQKLLDRLGAGIERGAVLDEAAPRQPLPGAASLGRIRVATPGRLDLPDPAWVALLGPTDAPDTVVGAARALGRGRVYLFATTPPFANDGLRDHDTAAFVLSLLDSLPRGAAVEFDEYHHGLTEHGTVFQRLLHDPWGWGVLYLAALVLAYAALRGRRFGRADPGALAQPRRARGEYVAALAETLRQGRHTGYAGQQYARQVKRQLARRFGAPADLAAEALATVLARRRPEAAALADPLGQLERGERLDDRSTLRLMQQAERVRADVMGT